MAGWSRNTFAAVITFLFVSGSYALAENRVALVIGNSNYLSVPPLVPPATDTKALADLLAAANFEVIWGADIAQMDMRRAIRDFSAKVIEKGPDTVALVFYAGYGIQVDGENFLIPIDARIERESDVAVEALRLADIINAVSTPPSKARIVIIDAAYGNPFTRFKQTSGRGLAIVDAPTGTIVAYSTAPGTEGANGPFTATLINASKIPGLSIDEALGLVRIAMFEAGNGNQLPWEISKLTTGFSLFPGPTPTTARDLQIKPAEFWRKEIQSRPQTEALRFVLSQDATIGYEEFLRIYPQTPFARPLKSLLDRRQEMVAWQNAYKLNSVTSYDGFLKRYPRSDFSPTAQRLLDRTRANFTTASSPPVAVVTPPPANDVSPNRSAKDASNDKEAKPRRNNNKTEVRRRERTAVTEESSSPPQSQLIPLGIGGIGIGGIGIGFGRQR